MKKKGAEKQLALRNKKGISNRKTWLRTGRKKDRLTKGYEV